jgi:hypothetical protein
MTASTDPAGATPPPTTIGFLGRGPRIHPLCGGRPSSTATASTAFANIATIARVGESPALPRQFLPLHIMPQAMSVLQTFSALPDLHGQIRAQHQSVITNMRSHNLFLTINPL